MRLVVGTTFWKTLSKHFEKRTEQVAFLFLAQTEPGVFETRDIFVVPKEDLVDESDAHAEVSNRVLALVFKKAANENFSLCEIHSHPFSKTGTRFSPSDRAGFAEFVPHVWWRLRKRPYCAVVLGRKDCDALIWIKDPNHPDSVSAIDFGDRTWRPTNLSFHEIMASLADRERYVRQELFFGKEGQRKMASMKVALVGGGGVGSHVAQQLAYLGVLDFALIDDDRVDGTNLNRLVGATEEDLGKLKIEVAERLIRAVQPRAHISPIDGGLLTKNGLDAIKTCDIAFGCVDEDGVRQVLLEACCSFKKPYIDIATDVPDENTFGGRIVFTGLGKGCLKCREELDDEEIDWYFSTPDQRREKEHIYGVNKRALGSTGPSVIFLNGVVASVGVQEFAFFVNPALRKPFPYLEYRGNMGLLLRPPSGPNANCYFCQSLWNAKTTDDVYRYAKK